jgi:hypothetical protein
MLLYGSSIPLESLSEQDGCLFLSPLFIGSLPYESPLLLFEELIEPEFDFTLSYLCSSFCFFSSSSFESS